MGAAMIVDEDEDESESKEESKDQSIEENETEKDDGLYGLYCAPCNKSFKNTNAMEAHEKAKKHRDIVAKLKAAEIKENLKNGIGTEEFISKKELLARKKKMKNPK